MGNTSTLPQIPLAKEILDYRADLIALWAAARGNSSTNNSNVGTSTLCRLPNFNPGRSSTRRRANGQAQSPRRILQVPSDYPTISAAVDAAQPYDTILVAPGRYRESVVISPDLTGLKLVAAAGDCHKVVLDGEGMLGVGISIEAPAVHVHGLTLKHFVDAGIQIPGKVGGVRLVDNRITRIVQGPGIDVAITTGGCLLLLNVVTGCRGAGIRVGGKDHYLVANRMTGNGQHGAELLTFGNHMLFNRARDNRGDGYVDQQGNTIFYKNSSARGGVGFRELGLGSACLVGNTTSTRQVGMVLESRLNVVLENKIRGTLAGSGLVVQEGQSGQLVVRNQITDNYEAGVVLLSSDNMVVGNQLARNRLVDIYIAPETDYNLVAWNTAGAKAPAPPSKSDGAQSSKSKLVQSSKSKLVQSDTVAPRNAQETSGRIMEDNVKGIGPGGDQNGPADPRASTNQDTKQDSNPATNHPATNQDSNPATGQPGVGPAPPLVLRVPTQYTTIQAAVDAAADLKIGGGTATIVVARGKYRETVVISAGHDGLRLMAEGDKVVLDGGNLLPAGFDIRASHVLVAGFVIKHYVTAGILVSLSLAPRILSNRISHVTMGNGITLIQTFSALIWSNTVKHAAGCGLSITGMNSWVLENHFNRNGSHGVLAAETNTFGNAIVDNEMAHNGGDGFRDQAGPNLVMQNRIARNKGNGITEAAGGQGFANLLDNLLDSNQGFAIELQTRNNFLRGNVLVGERGVHHELKSAVMAIGSSCTALPFPLLPCSLSACY